MKKAKEARVSCVAIRTVFIVALALPGAGDAQWSPSATYDLGVGYGQMALSQAAMNSARRMSEGSEKAFSNKDKPEPIAEKAYDPTFTPDPTVSEAVKLRFARFYAGDDPSSQKIMIDKVDSGAYQEHFQQRMADFGLGELNDLVEVSAARLVLLWELVHGRKITALQAQAIREQLRSQFARDRWLRGMDDADKQELTETFVLHVAAADIAHAELLRRDDPELIARYRAGVQENLLPGGPRLDRLSVSDAGFVLAKAQDR
mgnify:FL=1